MKCNMAFFFVVVLITVGAWSAVLAFRVLPAIATAKATIEKTVPFETPKDVQKRRMLVLGDSTAYGVGATEASHSTAGRIASRFNLTVENRAKSGAVTRDVLSQIQEASDEKYDLALVQVGANDVIHFKSLDTAERSLDDALTQLSQKTDRIVLLTSGDIGNAPLWIFPLNRFYTHRTEYLRARFVNLLAKHNAVYVDLYNLPDPFSTDPARYYAPDGLHLSSEGYAVWAEYITDTIAMQWQDFDKQVQ